MAAKRTRGPLRQRESLAVLLGPERLALLHVPLHGVLSMGGEFARKIFPRCWVTEGNTD